MQTTENEQPMVVDELSSAVHHKTSASEWLAVPRSMTMSALGVVARLVKSVVHKQQPEPEPEPSSPSPSPSLPQSISVENLTAFPILKLHNTPDDVSYMMCQYIISCYLLGNCDEFGFSVTHTVVVEMMKRSCASRCNIPALYNVCCEYCASHFDGK